MNLMPDHSFLRESLGWGFLLWLAGYVLGIVFFFILPASLIGWVITPVAVLLTLWVLFKKVHGHYLTVAITWTVIAVALDYLCIVQLLKPPDGYYKPDVYLYYALTFLLPLAAGWWKGRKHVS